MTTSVTDAHAEALIPMAQRLNDAAKRHDKDAVAAVFADADECVGDPLNAARLLAVLAAGLCPDDAQPSELLAWNANRDEYHRLRGLGIASLTAGLLAARIAAGNEAA